MIKVKWGCNYFFTFFSQLLVDNREALVPKGLFTCDVSQKWLGPEKQGFKVILVQFDIQSRKFPKTENKIEIMQVLQQLSVP